jgi:hypothetical protein
MGDDAAMTESDYEDREPIPEDAATEEIEKAAEHDIGVRSLRHFIACEAERKANPPRGRAPVIKLDTTKRDMFAADKNRGDRAAWQASGSNRTFEEWKADRDAEALQLAKDNHAAMVAEADAKKLAVEVRKAKAAARKAENELAKAKALAEKAAAEAEKDALPVDYKGLYEALSGLFTVTTDRKLGLLLELQAQHERTFELTLHQFMRLGGEWWNEDFKKMVGHRATAIFKEIFPGERPTKRRMSKVRTPGATLTADTRYWANMYPRGVLEQAFAQVVEKLTKAGTIDQYRVEPFRKEMPRAMEEVEEMEDIHAAITDIYKEMMKEGRQIRSKESSTNFGRWKGQKIKGLRDKLRSNEHHGPTWVRRALTEALVQALPPIGTSPTPDETIGKPED